MSIIEAVRKYLQTCPLLKGGTLNVDFLPPEAVQGPVLLRFFCTTSPLSLIV